MKRTERSHGTEDEVPADRVMPHLDGVEHRFVDLPGLRMHVAEAGSGDPVLLLHGFPQHWWEWRHVIPALAEHYRVICPDLRGAGWTDAPAEGYTEPQLLADLVALLDELDLDRVRILAHDWGALVGFRLCFAEPERVRQFVALAIPHPYMNLDARGAAAMRHAWYQAAVVSPILGPRLLERDGQWLARYLFRRFGMPGTLSDEDLEYYLAPLREPARSHAGAALYRGFIVPEGLRIARGSFRDMHLATTTRVLIGSEDAIVSERVLAGSEAFADDLRVETVPGAAHFLPEEQPDAVVRAALQLFARD